MVTTEPEVDLTVSLMTEPPLMRAMRTMSSFELELCHNHADAVDATHSDRWTEAFVQKIQSLGYVT